MKSVTRKFQYLADTQLHSFDADLIDASEELFRLGVKLDSQGDRENAETLYQQSSDLFSEIDIYNLPAYAERQIRKLLHDQGLCYYKHRRYRRASAVLRTLVEMLENGLKNGVSEGYMRHLAKCLSMLALCQRKSRRLLDSRKNYQKALRLADQLKSLGIASVNNSDSKEQLGDILLGYSVTLRKLGDINKARKYRSVARNLLKSTNSPRAQVI